MGTKLGRAGRSDLRNGLLFVSPWIVGFTVFTAYPICASLYYSLCSYDGISGAHFVGLHNYSTLITDDPVFRKALGNTLYMIAVGLPVTLLVSLALALMLNLPIRGVGFYRTLYYLPSIAPVVSSAALGCGFSTHRWAL